MTFDFPTLIAHVAKTRSLVAGSIVGSGTVSNYDRSRGSSSLRGYASTTSSAPAPRPSDRG
jgi:2-keto-4-pentenoate hydratase/2-oxohepta-3-ene-1,7-dioic acid hydratase in catechol pathway